jgi:hypothetical protein
MRPEETPRLEIQAGEEAYMAAARLSYFGVTHWNDFGIEVACGLIMDGACSLCPSSEGI